MIKKIEIKGLFSIFDYSIEMPLRGESMILTGPNGYGKTTILSIIEALCSLDLLYFYSIPFKAIKVFYDEQYELSIESASKNDELTEDDLIELHSAINFTLSRNDIMVPTEESLSITLSTDWDRISGIYNKMSHVHRLPFPEEDNGSSTILNDLCSKGDSKLLKKRMTILNAITQTQKTYTSFMIMMRSLSVKAKFIPAQRLISSASEKSSEILRVAQDLKEYLRKSHYIFLSNSQTHDEKFITRLIGDEGKISDLDYNTRVKQISSTIIEAKRFDLAGNFYIPEYSESKSEILKSYIEDLEEKLSSLSTPIKELNLFSRLLDRKRFVGKRCRFSRKHGIQFISDTDTSVIPLDALSSGEINQIIMLYEFIFNIADESILMIDEPEISLHVVWQHEFMKDISEIASDKNLYVLIATHSPQIIGSRWKDCFDLYGVARR